MIESLKMRSVGSAIKHFRSSLIFSGLTLLLLLFFADFAYPACDPATTCSGNGTCSASGACVCETGFTGASCNSCATNYYGYPNCTFCNAATTCNEKGTCSATGGCVCNPGYTGASCNSCAANYYGYPNCTFCSAATTCNGKGTCSATGSCVCSTGFTGASCNSCATSYYNFPECTYCNATTTCNGKGTCNASGGCSCNPGYTGPSCGQCAAGYSGYPNCVSGPTQQPPPVISVVSPITALSTGGSKLIITGSNFGTSGKVVVGTQSCPIQSYSDARIECSLPAGEGKDLDVFIQRGGVNSAGFKFSYQPPKISNVSPVSGSVRGGTILTISGSSFGLKGSVTVGGKACAINTYDHTRITCTIPPGSAGKFPVVVTVAGQTSDSVVFTYTAS